MATDDSIFDSVITIRFDEDGHPIVNIGDHSAFAAAAILRYTARYMEEIIPLPILENSDGMMFGPADDGEDLL